MVRPRRLLSEAEAVLALELDEAANGAEPAGVLFAAEGGQHAPKRDRRQRGV